MQRCRNTLYRGGGKGQVNDTITFLDASIKASILVITKHAIIRHSSQKEKTFQSTRKTFQSTTGGCNHSTLVQNRLHG